MRLVIPDAPEGPQQVTRARPRWPRALVAVLLVAGTTALVWLGLRDRPAAPETVVQPTPAAAPRADGDTGERPVPYWVLAGGFADQSQASRAARRLRVDGWRVEILAPGRADSQFVVQVGPVSDRGAAEEAARSVRGATGATVRIEPVR